MKRKIDINTWNRKEHFEFFSQFDMPYFGIATTADVTRAYEMCKRAGISFFQYYLFCSVKAANETEAFRYRIENGEVFEYEKVSASATMLRADKTFAFTFIEYNGNFADFSEAVKAEQEAVNHSTGLRLDLTEVHNDVLHYSSLPWIKYTNVFNPRNTKYIDSVPKITFGKIFEENGKLMMPTTVDAHHALMDGYHAGEYLQKFQENLDAK